MAKEAVFTMKLEPEKPAKPSLSQIAQFSYDRSVERVVVLGDHLASAGVTIERDAFTSAAISLTAGTPHFSSGSTAATWAFGVITYCFRCRRCSYLTRCAAYSTSARINCSPASSGRTGSLSCVIFNPSSIVC